jgi:oligopeptide transport system permease protein
MGAYVARRLLQMIPVFFGATLLVYTMVFADPRRPDPGHGG